MNKDTILQIKTCVMNSSKEESKLTDDIFKLDGMSSKKIRCLLNNLCAIDITNYLEIGVWKGSTFISSLYKNDNVKTHYVIDSWHLFPGIKNEFISNCKTLLDITPNIIQSDCFNLSIEQKKSIRNISMFLYDGEHDLDSQSKVLPYYYDSMDDIFVYITHNFNDDGVQKVTQESIDNLKLKVMTKHILLSSFKSDSFSWWNGVGIFLLQK
jgi:hypothetical protein